MKRVSISEIMDATGLSRATVDRAINGRGRVHPRTREVVEETLRRLQAPEEAPRTPRPVADIVLRVGKGMMAQMRSGWDAADPDGSFHDAFAMTDGDLAGLVETLCRDVSRPLILTAKNTDHLVDVLREARGRGKRVIAMVSDLDQEARDFHVGIDNRAAGQTAAFLIGRTLGDRPSSVGVVLGNPAFRCHEDREIGYRSGLRANHPRVVLSAEAQGEDSTDVTREATLRMLEDHPALGAIYNVGGGNQGLAEALKETGRTGDVLVVSHEVNAVTAPLLRSGAIDFALSADPAALLDEALRLAQADETGAGRDSHLLDFGVFTRSNLPSYAPLA